MRMPTVHWRFLLAFLVVWTPLKTYAGYGIEEALSDLKFLGYDLDANSVRDPVLDVAAIYAKFLREDLDKGFIVGPIQSEAFRLLISQHDFKRKAQNLVILIAGSRNHEKPYNLGANAGLKSALADLLGRDPDVFQIWPINIKMMIESFPTAATPSQKLRLYDVLAALYKEIPATDSVGKNLALKAEEELLDHPWLKRELTPSEIQEMLFIWDARRKVMSFFASTEFHLAVVRQKSRSAASFLEICSSETDQLLPLLLDLVLFDRKYEKKLNSLNRPGDCSAKTARLFETIWGRRSLVFLELFRKRRMLFSPRSYWGTLDLQKINLATSDFPIPENAPSYILSKIALKVMLGIQYPFHRVLAFRPDFNFLIARHEMAHVFDFWHETLSKSEEWLGFSGWTRVPLVQDSEAFVDLPAKGALRVEYASKNPQEDFAVSLSDPGTATAEKREFLRRRGIDLGQDIRGAGLKAFCADAMFPFSATQGHRLFFSGPAFATSLTDYGK